MGVAAADDELSRIAVRVGSQLAVRRRHPPGESRFSIVVEDATVGMRRVTATVPELVRSEGHDVQHRRAVGRGWLVEFASRLHAGERARP